MKSHLYAYVALPLLLVGCQPENKNPTVGAEDTDFEFRFYSTFQDTPAIENGTLHMLPNGLVSIDEESYLDHSRIAVRADYTGDLIRTTVNVSRDFTTAERTGFIGPTTYLSARSIEDEYTTHLGSSSGGIWGMGNSDDNVDVTQFALGGGFDEAWLEVEVKSSQLKINDSGASLVINNIQIEQATLSQAQFSDQSWQLSNEYWEDKFCGLEKSRLRSSNLIKTIDEDGLTASIDIEYDDVVIGHIQVSGSLNDPRLEGTLNLTQTALVGTYDIYLLQDKPDSVYGYARLVDCDFGFQFERDWGWSEDDLIWESKYIFNIGAGATFEDLDILVAHGLN